MTKRISIYPTVALNGQAGFFGHLSLSAALNSPAAPRITALKAAGLAPPAKNAIKTAQANGLPFVVVGEVGIGHFIKPFNYPTSLTVWGKSDAMSTMPLSGRKQTFSHSGCMLILSLMIVAQYYKLNSLNTFQLIVRH